jgi:hypothetical protein
MWRLHSSDRVAEPIARSLTSTGQIAAPQCGCIWSDVKNCTRGVYDGKQRTSCSSNDAGPGAHACRRGASGVARPQQEAPCATCGGGSEAGIAAAPVYAIGRIEARFSRAAVEKEFAQVRARIDTTGKSDRGVFHQVLTDRTNRYLVRNSAGC